MIISEKLFLKCKHLNITTLFVLMLWFCLNCYRCKLIGLHVGDTYEFGKLLCASRNCGQREHRGREAHDRSKAIGDGQRDQRFSHWHKYPAGISPLVFILSGVEASGALSRDVITILMKIFEMSRAPFHAYFCIKSLSSNQDCSMPKITSIHVQTSEWWK